MSPAKETSHLAQSEKFLKKLKSVCKKCSPASIAVYRRNILRLWRLVNKEGPIPLTGEWLKKSTLLEKLKGTPLKTRRHLSVALVKAGQTYNSSKDLQETFSAQMYKDANAYQVERNKNKKSPTEEKKWPKHGIKSVKNAARDLMKRVRLLGKEPSMKTLYRYQMALLLRLYSEIPFRNTFATFDLKKKDNNNYLDIPKRGKIRLIVRKHKSADKIGPKTVELSRGAAMFLRKFLKYRATVVDNDYLLNTMQKKKMSRSALGKALHRVTGELLGKKFGSRLIRVLAATAERSTLLKAQELGNRMLHSSNSKQTLEYSRK